jgi:hypothetical protein
MRSPALARTLAVLALLAAVPAGADIILPPIPYDAAGAKISVITATPLSGTNKLPPGDMRKARKAMIAGAEISDQMLRDLADQGDSLAAQKYVQRLVDRGIAQNASDIAYYGSFAVGTGKVFLLKDTIEAMRRLDPATEPQARRDAYVAMLYPHAWAGNTLALDAVIGMNGEGRLFGPMTDETRARITEVGERLGGPRFALRQALIHLQNRPMTAGDRAEARRSLAIAAQSQDLTVRVTAENLLRQLDAEMADGT